MLSNRRITAYPTRTGEAVKRNPVPLNMEPYISSSQISRFTGNGIFLEIAKWYYERGWDVENDSNPTFSDYPYFAYVSRLDNEGKLVDRFVSLSGKDAVLFSEAKEKAASYSRKRHVDLWQLTVKESTNEKIVYIAKRYFFTGKNWSNEAEETAIFNVMR